MKTSYPWYGCTNRSSNYYCIYDWGPANNYSDIPDPQVEEACYIDEGCCPYSNSVTGFDNCSDLYPWEGCAGNQSYYYCAYVWGGEGYQPIINTSTQAVCFTEENCCADTNSTTGFEDCSLLYPWEGCSNQSLGYCSYVWPPAQGYPSGYNLTISTDCFTNQNCCFDGVTPIDCLPDNPEFGIRTIFSGMYALIFGIAGWQSVRRCGKSNDDVCSFLITAALMGSATGMLASGISPENARIEVSTCGFFAGFLGGLGGHGKVIFVDEKKRGCHRLNSRLGSRSALLKTAALMGIMTGLTGFLLALFSSEDSIIEVSTCGLFAGFLGAMGGQCKAILTRQKEPGGEGTLLLSTKDRLSLPAINIIDTEEGSQIFIPSLS